MDPKPAFPIRVVYYEGGDVVEEAVYEDEDELAVDLEFFDSEDRPEEATVLDRHGRRVRVVIEAQELVTFELAI